MVETNQNKVKNRDCGTKQGHNNHNIVKRSL